MLSVAVITLNEESRLAECLASAPFADEFVVVDSGSTDATRQVAEKAGARFFERPFDDFSSQKNHAIDRCSHEWILLLDADERLSPELQAEIRATIADPGALGSYELRRVNHLFGGVLRHGANAEDWQLRLIRKGEGRFEGLVHERVRVKGKTGRLKGLLIHRSYQTLAEYSKKFPKFSTLDAEVMWRQNRRPSALGLLWKPAAHFVYFYFLKLGVLDGPRGFLYQVLASRYVFVKQLKAMALFRERGKP